MADNVTSIRLRHPIGGAAGAALALLVLAALLCARPAAAHQVGPNYETRVVAIEPATPGLSAQVDEGRGELVLTNKGDKRVIAYGYDKEPFARFDPDGRVFLNRRSPAYYLNDDIYADVKVPAYADAEAAPVWKQVAGDGSWSWHDHRIHWMSPTPPKNVDGVKGRKKIFDWKIPLRVGGTPAAVDGTLWWVGQPAAPQTVSYIVFASSAIVVLISGIVLYRRSGPEDSEGAIGEDPGREEEDEAW